MLLLWTTNHIAVKQICRRFAVYRLVVHNNNIRSVGFLVGYGRYPWALAVHLIQFPQKVVEAIIWMRTWRLFLLWRWRREAGRLQSCRVIFILRVQDPKEGRRSFQVSRITGTKARPQPPKANGSDRIKDGPGNTNELQLVTCKVGHVLSV